MSRKILHRLAPRPGFLLPETSPPETSPLDRAEKLTPAPFDKLKCGEWKATARGLTPLLLVLSGVLAVLLAACGGGATPTAVPTSSPAAALATAAAPAPTAPPATAAAPAPTAVLPSTTTPAPTAVPPPTVTSVPTAVPALFPLTLESSDGGKVIFDAPPERIVAYDGAAVETLFAIGEGHRVVGTHSWVTYPPETESIAKLGDAFDVDIEAVVALEPDLVFVFYDRFNEDLERAGMKVLYRQSVSDDFNEIPDTIIMWGEITGSVASAAEVAAEFQQRVEAIEKALEGVEAGPSVFQDDGGLWTPGQNTLMQAVFDLLKLDNVASDLDGYQQISPEVVVAKSPEIIIGDPEAFAGEAAFSQVRAVLAGRILTPTTNALSVAGPRFIEGVEELARWVYPDIFR